MAGPVVVGVDGSAAAADALCWALDVAAAGGSSLEVVRAGGGDARSQAQAQLAAARERLPQREVAAEVVVEDGDPSSLLLSREASLLVLGRHGTSALRRRLVGPALGSVAGHCLDRSTAPVAVVPPGSRPGAPGRVVVGLDLSASSRRALRWAAGHARLVGAPVTAVLAWELTTLPAPASPPGTVAPIDEWQAKASLLLARNVDEALGPDAGAVLQLAVHRGAARGLLEQVAPDDLLVLGARGRGGFERLLLGSVSRQCAEHAPCPVVVVPHRHRDATPVEQAPAVQG